ncbi:MULTISPECIES: hypothetical protein [Deinococcus]|uniref:Uncharacterized protein n=1 Tax=Deinococcus soli (ex Cha et al. 2016) TaxID=1309411 RepID=A0A0F7JMA5_9DEIO|nr:MULTISPECIES: hypothetical protein [Deinococcus]AKH17471.1 hypothetical protein SY84_10950 [Deinococcus soli (ex Cha et al. 2016)]MDK2014642.1 hypothetical protein [Deinococcus sp. 43]GGB67306.1 hypothetical protein GCM10008019_24330 [Deinococcus soli (ex Cha et al. 2016)]
MDELARHLAQTAYELKLAGHAPAQADPEALAALARAALEELIARGLLPDPEPDVGCWSVPRSGLH